MSNNPLNKKLKHHVTGAIERGEKTAIEAVVPPKHTPGPWTAAVYKVTPTMVERMKIGSVHHAVSTNHKAEDPTELLVAVCGDEPGLDSQSAADARLIAAAPELLETLLLVQSNNRLMNALNTSKDRHILDAVQRVIAKAEGRES